MIHEGAALGANAIDGRPAEPWEGPIIGIVEALQDTTIDLVIAGHTHRIANTVVGRIPVVEGVNAGAQLLRRPADGRAAATSRGPARRRASPRTSASPARADVQAIVDAANAETAVLRNEVIGTQAVDIRRDPTRLSESAMGNLVADAMRAKYPGVDAALTNSGGLRADLLVDAAVGGRAAGRDHLGRGVRRAAVRQPHGDRDADRRAAPAALLNGVQPGVQPGDRHGALPAGLRPAGSRSTATARRR